MNLQWPDKGASQPYILSSVGPSVVEPIDWQSVNEKRLKLLATVCRNSSLWNLTHTTVGKFVLDRIFVCDKHKILFCQTPKVGNTQWKKVLIVLNGKICLQESSQKLKLYQRTWFMIMKEMVYLACPL
ncbi:hypothetical protein cypCar_00036890 [Cyprinus carpio]|nr:hypothetical protein cypCar_00036890 [Cyprinus carpio]